VEAVGSVGMEFVKVGRIVKTVLRIVGNVYVEMEYVAGMKVV